MNRFRTTLPLALAALALSGCLGDGLDLFDSEPLVDEYTGFDQEIRGNYALGAPVTFEANLEDGMSGEVDIQVPAQFTVLERGADFVSTTADSVGTGEVVIRLDGDTIGRYDTRVAEVDDLEYRRVFNGLSREEYDETKVFHSSASVEVVVDFYGEGRRLYGRAITTVPESEDWRVETTSNNDRVHLDNRLAGLYEIPISVSGAEVGTVAFERVETVSTFELRLVADGDNRSVRPVVTDAEGRPVIAAPSWSVDGSPTDSLYPLENIGIGEEGGLVEATLDGETRSLMVPPL
jgi:hypothetical protein